MERWKIGQTGPWNWIWSEATRIPEKASQNLDRIHCVSLHLVTGSNCFLPRQGGISQLEGGVRMS